MTEVLADGFAFPECPVWHDGALWFSDVYAGRVHRLDPDGTADVVAEVDGHPAGLGFLPDGRLLVAAGVPRTLLRLEADGSLVEHADLSGVATWHLNDMHVDAAGRAYVGNYGDASAPPDPPYPAELALVQPTGEVSSAATGLMFANGIDGLADGRTLVVAETRSTPGRLTAFTVGPAGELSERRVLAELDVMPDGIAVAPDDSVWVASPFTSELLHVSPDGEVVERLAVPTPYAVALGGPDRDQLLVCSSPTWVPDVALRDLAGAVLRVR